jgi:hypothetical protein
MEVAMRIISIFLALVLTVGLGASAEQPKPKETPLKVIDESGSKTSIDPDRIVIETPLGQRQTLRELLSKVDRVSLQSVSITYRDAGTKAVIKSHFSLEGPPGRNIANPGYHTDFPRDFRVRTMQGGFDLNWVGLEGVSLTVKVGADGYKSKQVVIDKKVLDKGRLDVFLEKEEPTKAPARD